MTLEANRMVTQFAGANDGGWRAVCLASTRFQDDYQQTFNFEIIHLTQKGVYFLMFGRHI
jgi:hypothetical protein